MTAIEKRLTIETWMAALDTFKRRLRKSLKIVLGYGVPVSVVRQAVNDILDQLEEMR